MKSIITTILLIPCVLAVLSGCEAEPEQPEQIDLRELVEEICEDPLTGDLTFEETGCVQPQQHVCWVGVYGLVGSTAQHMCCSVETDGTCTFVPEWSTCEGSTRPWHACDQEI